MEPGIYHDIPSQDYHAMTDIVSNSYLGRLAKVPAYARVLQTETEAMRFGSAFHAYVLEGETALWKDYCLPDTFPTKPNKRSTQKTIDTYALWEASLMGKRPLTVEDYDTIRFMRYAILSHPFASKLLESGVSETTLIWQDEETGLMCKARPDRTPDKAKSVIFDLKSTRNAGQNSFINDCVKYGYAREGAIYLEGYSRLTGILYQDLIFCLIAVEKEPPYRVEVYTLEVDFLQYGWGEFHRLLQIEKQCRDNNFWPHYLNAGAEPLYKPAYLRTWEFEPLKESANG
jgi:hypothetical protein